MILPEHLRRNGFFKTILFNDSALEEVCVEYVTENETPNIAGLCAHLGTTPHQLRNLFFSFEGIPPEERARLGNRKNSPDPAIPSESTIQYLANVIMHIEASVVSGGLTGRFNAHMSKFVLSAFHDRHEKTLQESKTDNRITVHLKSHTPVDMKELQEYQRLEAAIAEEQRLELLSMGRIDEDEAVSVPPRADMALTHPTPYEDDDLSI